MAKILIIGGGVSGLSAGIYAQLGGHSAVICEMGATVGGNLTGWDRGEYHIDNCIHWLTGTNPVTEGYRMWVTLGALGGVRIIQGESLYTYELDGKTISLYSDLEKIEREMLDISPADSDEIRSFISAVRAVQGICNIAGKDHDRGLARVKGIASLFPLYRYYRMSTGELSKKFSHPLLSGFISCFLGEDFGALALIIVFAHFCGMNAGIPAGGSRQMAERMAERFLSLGGQIYLNRKAERINVDSGIARSVSFSDGVQLDADYIVITADPATVFGKLLDAEMPHSLAMDYKDKRKQRFSCIQCAFACESDELPFRADIIFELDLEYRMRLGTKNLILREFSHDKSFAPSGASVIQSMIFCNEARALQFIELSADKNAYRRLKEEMAQTVKEIIEKKYPSLAGKISLLDVWTPATYKRFVGSEMGSFMSFTMPSRTLPLGRSALVPGVDNLLLASQWQQSPGGLPIAAERGRMAIEQILRLERKRANKRQGEYKKAYS